MPLCLQCVFLMMCFSYVYGTSQGALPKACDNMTPHHYGVKGQTGAAPFRLTVDKTEYRGEETIIVKLSKTSNKTFKGFLIQARNEDGKKIEGFRLSAQSKFLQCDSPNDTVTHTEASAKQSYIAEFIAPSTSQGNIAIFATVVHNFETYWVRIQSDLIIDRVTSGASSTFLPNTLAVVTVVFIWRYVY
ncbi:putative ferric-chelate reductase 1 [Mytilus trossulus]|uniref:putative ferric-chelate reductase 1 n=1 Tax=Mytilus trossulus TaxID=6551 RepID=UPI003004FA11